MNHKASIYSNPLIPPSLYYCQLFDIHLDTSDSPYIWASLRTGHSYGDFSDQQLSSIIYLTPKSELLVEKLRRTFRVVGHDTESYAEAIGCWGCVSIFPKEYQSQKFSCVTYVLQNGLMQRTAAMLEAAGDGFLSEWEAIPGQPAEG